MLADLIDSISELSLSIDGVMRGVPLVSVLINGVIGIPLLLFGRRLFHVVLFFGGAIVTALIVSAFPDTKWWHVTLGFLAGGFIAYLLTYVGLALIGSLIGGVAGLVLFGAEPTAVIICSFVGAVATILVHELGLIVASSLIGAGFVSAMFSNIATIFTAPQNEISNNGLAAIADFVTIFLNHGLVGFAERAEAPGYIFILLFLSGVAFQIFWHPSDIVPESTNSDDHTRTQHKDDQQTATPSPPAPEPAAEPQSDTRSPSETTSHPASTDPEATEPSDGSQSAWHSIVSPELTAGLAVGIALFLAFLAAGLGNWQQSSRNNFSPAPTSALSGSAVQSPSMPSNAGDVVERRRDFGQEIADAEQHGFFKVRTASNLRAGPGTSHAIELTLPEHTILRVIGRAPASADWLAVEVEAIRERGSSMRRGFLYRPLVEPIIARRGTNPWEPRSGERVVLQRFNNGFFEGIQTATGQRRLGVYVWNDGAWYAGEWDENNRSGRGQQFYHDGWHYDGEWRDHIRNGRGEIRSPDGHRYVGEWSDGRRTGSGTYYWPDGDRHVGEFLNNQRHGRGVHYFANGNRREGTWRDGRLHGTARLVQADGTATIEYWNNGERADSPPADASPEPPATRTPPARSSSRLEAARALIANNCSNTNSPEFRFPQVASFDDDALVLAHSETFPGGDIRTGDHFFREFSPAHVSVQEASTDNSQQIRVRASSCNVTAMNRDAWEAMRRGHSHHRCITDMWRPTYDLQLTSLQLVDQISMYCRNRGEVVNALVALGATRAGQAAAQDTRQTRAASAITHGPALRIASARAKREANSSARLAIDGNLSTTYGSRGIYDFDRDPNMWWEADLGSVRDVGSMRLMWGVVPTYKRVTISGSQDGRSYTQIAGPLDVNTTGQWTDIALSGRHRYIRINYVGSGSGGHGLDLTEVEIFGPQTRQQAQAGEDIFRCTTGSNREASVRIEGSQAVYRYSNLNTGRVELTLSKPVRPGFIQTHARGRSIQFRSAPDYTYTVSETLPGAGHDIGAGTSVIVQRGGRNIATIECRDVQTSLIIASLRLGH